MPGWDEPMEYAFHISWGRKLQAFLSTVSSDLETNKFLRRAQLALEAPPRFPYTSVKKRSYVGEAAREYANWMSSVHTNAMMIRSLSGAHTDSVGSAVTCSNTYTSLFVVSVAEWFSWWRFPDSLKPSYGHA